MLDNNTKKRIDDCRDILVGKLPDPKSQIEQITIALIYKFMDDMDKEAIDLGGQAKFFTGEYANYSWDALFDAKVTATEMLKLYSAAIESMEKNPNIPQLFRDIFKNAYLPYRDPETLKLFLKTIGEFEYTHSEKLGDAFEYLLSVMGSQGDAGQFRTPRHIIDFLVAAVNPDKTDTILDPACGTAGFLISAFKHITRHAEQTNSHAEQTTSHAEQNNSHPELVSGSQQIPKQVRNDEGKGLTPDERKKLILNFIGYDISPDMVRLSLVNLYLHGFSDPHIFEYDTLTSEQRWDDTYDVILANPPFMSPKGGIRPHKKFTVASNRSEVLFVDYIAEHLNPKGRAGIIVPEGVIFQSGKAYKELRKMLVDNYLYAVVSLPAGVFNPYSGVKTSILLMDRELAKKSSDILFIKIDNDGYNLGAQRTAVKGGQLDEAIKIISRYSHSELVSESTIAHTVPKTKIADNGEYNLSGERYKVNTVIDSDFEMICLSDVCLKITDGSHFSPKTLDVGYPYITVKDLSDGVIDFVSCKNIEKQDYQELVKNGCKPIKDDLLFSKDGTVGKTALIENDKEFVVLSSLAIIRPDVNKILPKYLYVIASGDTFIQEAIDNKTGVAIKRIVLKTLKQIQIPLPPLAIQEEIVAEIEGYQKIIDGAKMVVDHYKPQITIDPDWEMVELQSICDVRDGTHDSPKYVQEGGIPFVTQKNITKEGLTFDKVNYISEEDHEKIIKRSNVEFEDIIISMIGVNRGMSCMIDDTRTFSIKNVGLVKPQGKVEQKYLLYYLQSQNALNYVERVSAGGAQSFISLRNLRAFPIPLTNLKTQRQIVAQIEKEQEMVNASKQLIAVFEQKIKDRIARVWGTKKEENKEQPLPIAAEAEVGYGKG